MSLLFYTLDVFTDRRFGGNQLAVMPHAEGLADDVMLAITREFNYSESVFVSPPSSAEFTRRVRIFTPGGEVDFAGHPTVGTAHLLVAIGEVPIDGELTRIVLEENVGPVGVTVRSRGGVPMFAELSVASLPEIGPPPPSRERLAAMLGIDAADILDGAYEPQAISCGLPFLLVPLRDRAAVRRAKVRLDLFERELTGAWASLVMVFAADPELPGSDIRARMFGPMLGVPEDPATGSACATLGGYLAARTPREGTLKWVVEQGFEMGRPSILYIEADKRDGEITAVRVGGSSVVVSRGELLGV